MHLAGSPRKLDLYEKLMRLDKPIGTLLLLWPTLWALWLAVRGVPQWRILIVFVVGTVLMRSAGVVVNDYADRNFDPHVARTKDRPLAAGLVGPTEALVLAGVLGLMAFALVLTLNRLTVALSFVGAFLAVSYPFTKRFFALPQAYLGIAFGFGIPMAYARTARTRPCRGLGAAACEHLLDHRVRHRVRHGGPGRRSQDRHPHLGDPVRPLRRRRRHVVPRRVPRAARGDRLAHAAWRGPTMQGWLALRS